MSEQQLMIHEIGYRACQIDVQAILLDLKTPENIALLCEIDRRIQEMVNIRVLTDFAETQD